MARPATHRAEDWIAAGWRALGRGGPAAVRIEALARNLGVTKGSCYGYFADRAALLSAISRAASAPAFVHAMVRSQTRRHHPRPHLQQLPR